MQIQAFTPLPLRPFAQTLATAAPASGGPTDQVTLSDAKRNYKAVAWAGFGVQVVGAGLTFAGHGPLGVAIFAAGAGMIVYGEYMARRG